VALQCFRVSVFSNTGTEFCFPRGRASEIRLARARGHGPPKRRGHDSDHPGRPFPPRLRLGRALTVSAEPLLLVVVGPTASGKTALSLALAARFRGEIVNCDSVAMYREFEIGTAKPSAAERAQAPHHLIGSVDPAGYMTAGDYSRLAREVLKQIQGRGNVGIVVGGTGLYLRALLEGLFPGPRRSEPLRQRLRLSAERRPAYLHRVLRRLDPDSAKRIHANDGPKLVRAIEVCVASRESISEMWKQGRSPLTGFRILRLGLDPDRDALYGRINLRAQKMFDSGLVEETRDLLERYGDSVWALSSLGYKQAVQLIRGEMDRPGAVQATQQAHRNYAKRQMTWFRRDPMVHWLPGFGDDTKIQREAIAAAETEAGV
jgi:tRNA dimethylallyltransferase